MNKPLRKVLMEGKLSLNKRTYFWSLASSVAFSIQSAVFLMIATRFGGEAEAGAFILLFTVAQTLNAVGNYNLRDFQASDIREEYAFQTYYTTRLLTCGAMAAASAGYCLFRGTSLRETAVLFSLVGYRVIECVEDVSHGAVQRMGRFDVSSLCMTLRIGVSSFFFCLVYILTGDQTAASAALLAVSLIVYAITIRLLREEFPGIHPGWNTARTGALLKAGFPLFISAFLYSYLINAPKYAIDAVMSREAQTTYNILFMPIFAINMLSMFIYKPMIVRMSELWTRKDTGGFLRSAVRQLGIILALTLGVAAAGWAIGLRLLEMIYGVSLTEYRGLFVLLLLFGGVVAGAYYLTVLMTIQRQQRLIVAGYGAALALSLLTTRGLVRTWGLNGAGLSYGIIVSCLFIFDLAAVLAATLKMKKNAGEKAE